MKGEAYTIKVTDDGQYIVILHSMRRSQTRVFANIEEVCNFLKEMETKK